MFGMRGRSAPLHEICERRQGDLDAVRELELRGAARKRGARRLVLEKRARFRFEVGGARRCLERDPGGDAAADALALIARDRGGHAGRPARDRLQQRGSPVRDDEPRAPHERREIALREGIDTA